MKELEESRSSAQLFEQSLDRFEEIKSKKDAKIAQLKEALDDVRAQLDDAHEQARIKLQEAADEARSLRSTIENNLKIQAASEAALRQEIENMKSGGDYAKPRRRKPGKPKISSIDESLDDTDWLVPTPPEGSNVKVSGVADSEFGYQEPKRRNNPPENSAQMSLW